LEVACIVGELIGALVLPKNIVEALNAQAAANHSRYMKQCLKKNTGFVALIGIALLVMAGVTVVDKTWTVALSRHRLPQLVAFMEDSLFEGESWGANDLVTLLLLGVVAAYYVAWRWPGAGKIARWRPQTGFILTSALVTGVYLVHSLKWVIGRARPDLVLEHKAAFSHWFTFGPFSVADGIFYGSFPSGHTSQAFILMAAAIALAGDPLVGKPVRVAGWLWGIFALVFSLAMGAARCMTLSHWLSDILGSIFLGGICMHLLYFKVLRVPDQRRYADRYGRTPELPQVWEIIFCFHVLLGTVGVVALIIGARAIWIGKIPWLVAMVPMGAGLVWVAWQKSAALLRQVWQTLAMPAQDF
jgi:membrane-associated phospholipid phosphatase